MNPDNYVGIGVVVLLLSTVALLATGLATAPVPSATAALAVLGMAVGSILVGTAVDGSPV